MQVASKVEADEAWCNLVNRWDLSDVEVWLGSKLLFRFQRLSTGEPVLLKPGNRKALIVGGQEAQAA